MTGSEDAFRSLIDKLLQKYRFVFVDLPAAFGMQTRESAARPEPCVLVSNGSLVCCAGLVRWQMEMGPNSPERSNDPRPEQSGRGRRLPQEEFYRAVGKTPDIIIPYQSRHRKSREPRNKGIEGCAGLHRALRQLSAVGRGPGSPRRPSILKSDFWIDHGSEKMARGLTMDSYLARSGGSRASQDGRVQSVR